MTAAYRGHLWIKVVGIGAGISRSRKKILVLLIQGWEIMIESLHGGI